MFEFFSNVIIGLILVGAIFEIYKHIFKKEQ